MTHPDGFSSSIIEAVGEMNSSGFGSDVYCRSGTKNGTSPSHSLPEVRVSPSAFIASQRRNVVLPAPAPPRISTRGVSASAAATGSPAPVSSSVSPTRATASDTYDVSNDCRRGARPRDTPNSSSPPSACATCSA